MSRSAPFQTAAGAIASQLSPANGVLLRKCSCGEKGGGAGKCDACKEKEEESLHRKASGASPSHEAPSIVHDVLRNQGRPLDTNTRADMEQRFGHDFAAVRVHTDSRASESATAVSALAYTVGQHVVFGANQYAPTTAEGRHLLAHELAHTVQQGGAGERRQNRLVVRGHDSPDERAADRAADLAVRGGSVKHSMPALGAGSAATSGSVQRKGGVLSVKEVEGIYMAWIVEMQRARGLKLGDDWPLELDQQVRERVKKQVGPGNYANFVRGENAQTDQHWEQAKAEEAKKKEAEEWARNFDPVADQDATVAGMWAATETLRKEVVRVERLAQKSDFGSGAKGAAARFGVAGYTALYGVGGRTVTSVSEHAPMLVLGTAGTALGIGRAEKLLEDEGSAIKQEGEEMGDDVRTAVRVAGGDLQANYEATRPSYNKYWEAVTAFGSHRSDYFNKYRHLSGMSLYMERSPHVGGMSTAMKEMKEAGSEFLMKCAQLGIESDAKALGKLGDNIIKGAEGAVETAVTGPLMEFAPGLGELKDAVKGGAKHIDDPIKKELKDQAAKQVKNAVDDAPITKVAKAVDEAPVTKAAKAVDEAPVASGAKKVDDAPVPSSGKPEPSPAQQAPAAPKSPKDAPPKAVPEADAKGLQDNVSNARPVTDQKLLDAGYVAEIPVGKHKYRRHKDGAWCRFSKPVCNVQVDPDIDKKIAGLVDDAVPAAPKKSHTAAAPDKAAADGSAGKKKRGPKEEGPEVKERREAKEKKAAQAEGDKKVLDSQIDTMQGNIDQIYKENAELTAKKVPRNSPEGKEIAEELALNERQLKNAPKTLEDLKVKRADLEVTPQGKARAYSHSGAADGAVRTRSRGLDEVSGKAIKEPSVDHVVPIDEMVLMDGWDDLAVGDQRAILSRLDNLKLMEKPANSSKGARSWENWAAGKRFYPDQYDQMVKLERQLRADIKKQVELLAKARKQ